MRPTLRAKAISVCEDKIAKKGDGVGLSFYAFFANRNDDPDLLMEAAEWWIKPTLSIISKKRSKFAK